MTGTDAESPLWHRIQTLLETHEIEREEFAGSQLVALYAKARAADRDARNATLHVDSRSTLAYQALHQYADILGRLHGLRVKRSQRHHRNLFQVVNALQVPDVGNLEAAAEGAARERTRAFYDLEASTEKAVTAILAINDRLAPIVRRELLARHPDQRVALEGTG